MQRVHVYIDGPNLLGAIYDLRKQRLWIDPIKLSDLLIDAPTQRIQKGYYAETPYQGSSHRPETFRKQQSFFGTMHKYLSTGQLIHIQGVYRKDEMRVPYYIVQQLRPEVQQLVQSLVWTKPIEKGGDVGLAVQLVRDAFVGEFDAAILVTADQDFAPAVNIVTAETKHGVAIGYVHNTTRNAMALRNRCPQARFVQVTRQMIERCAVGEGRKTG